MAPSNYGSQSRVLAAGITVDLGRMVALAEQADEQIAVLEAGQTPGPEPAAMLYGYGHSNRASLEHDTGVLVRADRYFAGGKPIPPEWTRPDDIPGRYYVVHSFKPGDWTQAGTGADADRFQSFLASVTEPMATIPHHEPENDGRNPKAYRDMILRYDALAAEVGNPLVTMAWCLMRSWIEKPAGQRSEDYLVPAAELALPWVLSWDGYHHKAEDTAASLFDPCHALAAEYGHRFAISETATDLPGHAATYVKQVTDYAATRDAAWCCYWPSQTNEQGASDYYPPEDAWPAFADVALHYGGTPA